MNSSIGNKAGLLRLMVMIFAVMVLIGSITEGCVSAASHSQKYWMKKTLKAYKTGRFSAAKKYNKKMNKIAKVKCVKKMSAAQKKKYRTLVKKWARKSSGDSYGEYLWDYYLADYNNDGKADLILHTGSCEADAVFRVYTYKKGKLKKIGKFGGGHSYLSAYPGCKGVIRVTQHMEYERICRVYRKSGKTVSKVLNSHETRHYMTLRNELKSHVYYSDYDYSPHFKYGDLK